MSKNEVLWLAVDEPYEFVGSYGFEPMRLSIIGEMSAPEEPYNGEPFIAFSCNFSYNNIEFGFGHASARYGGQEFRDEIAKKGFCICHGLFLPLSFFGENPTAAEIITLANSKAGYGSPQTIGFIGSLQNYPTRKKPTA
jgi:hypothetical protein